MESFASARTVNEDGTVVTKCDKCRLLYEMRSERTGEEHKPPCKECIVVLDPANKEISEVYFMSRDQVLATYGQVIGINDLAVKHWMDLLGIQDQLTCAKRVKKVFHYFLNKRNEEREAESKNNPTG